jgi:hypothetical protein
MSIVQDKIIAAVGAGLALFGAAIYAVDRPDVSFHVTDNHEALKEYKNAKVYVFATPVNSPTRVVIKTENRECLEKTGHRVTPLIGDHSSFLIWRIGDEPRMTLRDACKDCGVYTEAAYEKPSWMIPGYTHRGTKRFYWHEYM